MSKGAQTFTLTPASPGKNISNAAPPANLLAGSVSHVFLLLSNKGEMFGRGKKAEEISTHDKNHHALLEIASKRDSRLWVDFVADISSRARFGDTVVL